MNDHGSIDFKGLGGKGEYYKGLYDKLGIKYMVAKVGKYKSYVESNTLTGMSDYDREQRTAYLNGIWNYWLKEMAEGRKVKPEALNQLANDSIMALSDAKDYVTAKLVDKILFPEELKAEIKNRLKIDKDDDINQLTLSDMLNVKSKDKKDGEKIAIYYAYGSIVDSETTNLLQGGGHCIVGKTTAEGLRKLADDDDIKAVVFRVNSGGGSAVASEQIRHALKLLKAKKPVVVSMGGTEDHEAFNPSGEGFYWHDAQHGWAFKDGNKIDLLVGPKATVRLALCQYGQGDSIYVRTEAGDTLTTLKGKVETDGGFVDYTYNGEGGTLSFCIKASGEMYIHTISIINIADLNFDQSGNWYFVKRGSVKGFTNALKYINEINTDNNTERKIIFLPAGVYDLKETVQTNLSTNNLSIIGQSMDSTIIVSAPGLALEGLGSAEMFVNTSQNLYLQDLTLKNAFDYYKAGTEGRAPVIYDNGNHTMGKNVRMISGQSTYYSFNNGIQSYWDSCDFHGAVDILCGGGDIRFNNSTISLEPRYSDGSGHRTIAAPRTMTKFGFIFDHCKVIDLTEGYGTWDFGRTWSNQPIAVYISTTLDENAVDGLISSRWTEKGMNSTDPSVFGEYNTMDVDGNDITPLSNAITSYSGIYQTILNADMVAHFSYDKMFSKNADKAWDPAAITAQIDGPSDARYDNGTITWSAVNGAIAYAVFKNGELEAITEDTSYDLDINPDAYRLSIRCANAMGGFGPEGHVAGTIGIKTVRNDFGKDVIYNLQGVRVSKPSKGIYIINGKKTVVR